MALKAALQSRELEEVYGRNVDAVYRVCFSFLRNTADTEDMVQETFIKFMRNGVSYDDPRHERAWLIVAASNACKSLLRRKWRKDTDIYDCDLPAREDMTPERIAVIDAVARLPQDYKTAIYMYYYEGYRTPEIARALHIPEATVRKRLSRARGLLKTELGGDSDD